MKPKVTVVIPAFNEEKLLPKTLESLKNQTFKGSEIIVVDNASTDSTSSIAKKYGARVVLEPNKGVSFARQAGFTVAKGDLILSTDADTIVPKNWIEEIVNEFEKDPSLVAFGGLTNLYSGPWTARLAARYLFLVFWTIDRLFSGGWNLCGTNMAVRRTSFLKTKGFDTSLLSEEDIDISKKLRLIGKVGFNSKLIVRASGRRFKNGLISGLLTYAPRILARYFGRKMFLKFEDIRD